MRYERLNKIIRWWMTPKLPVVHISIPSDRKEGNIIKKIKGIFRIWIIHPIKRRLAKYYLLFLRKIFGLKVIGLTGSAGKTTTKEIITSILRLKGETVATYKNIDPVYNIPTTILKCKPTTKYLILEMGVEYPGEMEFYLWFSKPDIGVITNVYPTHILYFKNIEGVAREKGKLVKSLSESNIAILNKENDYLINIAKNVKAKIVWFGDNSSINAENIKINEDMSTNFTLNINKNSINVHMMLPGSIFITSALAAVATCFSLNSDLSDIKKGIETFKLSEHRMKVIKSPNGATILDDSYNNNPEAARKALEIFNQIAGDKNKIVVFGDMLELGSLEKKYHLEIGEILSRSDINKLICVGNASKYTAELVSKKIGKNNVTAVPTWDKAVPLVKSLLKSDNILFIKGSRSIGLDRLVKKLLI